MMAADVLVLPSHREGFGMVLIEAAALGLPVIATDIYGIQDAVVNYETGLLFPPGDEGALIDSMTEFASNSSSRKKMGNAARARVAEMFEQNLVVSETIKYYRSIIK
jgi:glycosyltransferase involved in cell wall biosynthesis